MINFHSWCVHKYFTCINPILQDTTNDSFKEYGHLNLTMTKFQTQIQTKTVFADVLQFRSAASSQYQLTTNTCQLIRQVFPNSTRCSRYPSNLTLQNI